MQGINKARAIFITFYNPSLTRHSNIPDVTHILLILLFINFFLNSTGAFPAKQNQIN
jgi:hypothetical protein